LSTLANESTRLDVAAEPFENIRKSEGWWSRGGSNP
jgi:hypothetical protein